MPCVFSVMHCCLTLHLFRFIKPTIQDKPEEHCSVRQVEVYHNSPYNVHLDDCFKLYTKEEMVEHSFYLWLFPFLVVILFLVFHETYLHHSRPFLINLSLFGVLPSSLVQRMLGCVLGVRSSSRGQSSGSACGPSLRCWWCIWRGSSRYASCLAHTITFYTGDEGECDPSSTHNNLNFGWFLDITVFTQKLNDIFLFTF